MEPRHRERLSELVEQLTTSGRTELRQESLKELKSICRVSTECIQHVFRSLMSQLNQDHAEIRLSAFQVCSELFSRSHHFRTLLVNDFQEFLELTVETDSEQPLPPPKEVGRKLRSLAIQTVQSWHSSYGSSYKKLALGYHFLKQVKKVDFQDAEARTVSERRRQEERHRRMENIYRDRVEVAVKDMEESCPEIEATLVEMDSCMKLLLPDFSLDTLSEDQPCCSKEAEEGGEEEKQEREEEEESKDQFIRNSGLVSHSYSLDLKLSPELHVKETEDNEAVVSTVIDLHKLITTKHLPAVQRWTQVFSRSGAEQQLLRRSLDLKQSLEAALQKHKELHIDYKRPGRTVPKAEEEQEEEEQEEQEEEEEEEFEEVPEKEGYEPHIPEHLRAEYGLDPSPSTSSAPVPKSAAAPPPPPSCSSSSRRLRRLMEEEQDPTCAAATLRLLRNSSSVTPSECSGSAAPTVSEHEPVGAPVVPFGLDLYYWGEEQPNAGKIIKAASQHQFWVPTEVEEEVENQELLAQSKTRCISFPGTFTPVRHVCKAPLTNGTLCPRQDRLKCPFHGPIVPRDEQGRAQRPEDRERDERRTREQQPDWQDVELMRDIEAATGEDLGSDRVSRKKGKKKKKYPHLSDLKQSSNTSRSRLERKVFNKSSMRRMAEVLNKSDRRKHDKFSNQFNYALN